MSEKTGMIKTALKYLKNKKGQGLVGFGLIVAFSLVIGIAARDAGLLNALGDTYSNSALTSFAPSDIVPGETNVSGNLSAVTGGGGGTNSSGGGSGSGSGNSGSDSGNENSGSDNGGSGSGSGNSGSGSGNENSGSDNGGSGSGSGNSGGSGTEGGNSGGGNSTPGMPAGGQTGGGSGNTGSGTFEEKKAALEAKMKASAVANGTAASYQLGAVVNDNGAYKIVINAGQGWNNLVNYRIIDVNEALKASSDGKHISMNGGDIVIADDGNAYVNQYGHGWVSYPEDLYAQTSGCIKVKL